MSKLVHALNAALAHMERCTADVARLYNIRATTELTADREAEIIAELAAAGVELAVHTAAMFLIRDQINAGAARVVDTTATVKATGEGLN